MQSVALIDQPRAPCNVCAAPRWTDERTDGRTALLDETRSERASEHWTRSAHSHTQASRHLPCNNPANFADQSLTSKAVQTLSNRVARWTSTSFLASSKPRRQRVAEWVRTELVVACTGCCSRRLTDWWRRWWWWRTVQSGLESSARPASVTTRRGDVRQTRSCGRSTESVQIRPFEFDWLTDDVTLSTRRYLARSEMTSECPACHSDEVSAVSRHLLASCVCCCCCCWLPSLNGSNANSAVVSEWATMCCMQSSADWWHTSY